MNEFTNLETAYNNYKSSAENYIKQKEEAIEEQTKEIQSSVYSLCEKHRKEYYTESNTDSKFLIKSQYVLNRIDARSAPSIKTLAICFAISFVLIAIGASALVEDPSKWVNSGETLEQVTNQFLIFGICAIVIGSLVIIIPLIPCLLKVFGFIVAAITYPFFNAKKKKNESILNSNVAALSNELQASFKNGGELKAKDILTKSSIDADYFREFSIKELSDNMDKVDAKLIRFINNYRRAKQAYYNECHKLGIPKQLIVPVAMEELISQSKTTELSARELIKEFNFKYSISQMNFSMYWKGFKENKNMEEYMQDKGQETCFAGWVAKFFLDEPFSDESINNWVDTLEKKVYF